MFGRKLLHGTRVMAEFPESGGLTASMNHPTGPALVTGATGFLGSAVIRRLRNAGIPVRGLIRSTSRADRLVGLGVQLVTGDVRDHDAVRSAVVGCDSVIHLAGPSGWSTLDSPTVTRDIVEGIGSVLEAARRAGVRRVTHISTAAVLGPSSRPTPRDETSPESPVRPGVMPYLEGKRTAEEMCRQAFRGGLDVVIVNPCEVYGPGDRDLVTAGSLLPLLKSRVPLVCTGGTAIAHVDDIANGIVQAHQAGRSGERYFLGGENLSHWELARLLLSICGRTAPIFVVPNGVVRSATWAARRLRLPFPIPTAMVPYATAFWNLCTDKARRELGVSFRSAIETLAATVSWLKAAGHNFAVSHDSPLTSADWCTAPFRGGADTCHSLSDSAHDAT